MQFWHACTADSWVLATVQNGYMLQFHLGPPPFRVVRGSSGPHGGRDRASGEAGPHHQRCNGSAYTGGVHDVLGAPAGLLYDVRIPVRRQSCSYLGLPLPVSTGIAGNLLLCQKLLGLMAAAMSAIQLGLLRWVNAFHLNTKSDIHRRLTVSHACSSALRWMRTTSHLREGV
ncbi:UNVERIFIED_CONTAM: hypothetical protein FKN15_071880 [Acipenser sinensis]